MKEIFDYLYQSDKPIKADLIIGFGHFDLRIPELCCQLLKDGFGKKILFTGGVGGGTADLGIPEAQAFKEVALKNDISEDKLIIEDKSTNTSENIDFSLGIINDSTEPFVFQSAILVASPYRQRRVYLACKKKIPGIALINHSPQTTLDVERKIFADKNQDFIGLLPDELNRIIKYGERDWIEKEKVPDKLIKLLHNFAQDK